MILKPKVSSGYRLLDLGNSRWSLVHSKGNFTGTFDQVRDYALYVIGFEEQELKVAVNIMDKGFYNAAEFGVMKKFMYPYDEEEMNAPAITN